MPQADGNNLGAIYHGLTRSVADPVPPGIPIAWAVDALERGRKPPSGPAGSAPGRDARFALVLGAD